jgi:hypothetical protein
MYETLLRQLVIIRYLIKFEAGAEVLLPTLQGLDVLCVVFLKEYRSFGWRALFSHASVGVW